MTHHTDAERADFEAWLGIKPCGAAHDLAWSAWKAARRAPEAPVHQGLKLVPVVPTSEMLGAADREHAARGLVSIALISYQAMLAAAPQPPEAKASVSNGTFAAHVQMPEPAAWRDPKNFLPSQGCTYEKSTAKKWAHIYTEALYTEQQVREMLAAHGIGKEKA